MPVSERIRERRRNNPDAPLDRGCGVMTSPKPAHETIPNWPPSNWNGGRDQIGIGGRLRWNPHCQPAVKVRTSKTNVTLRIFSSLRFFTWSSAENARFRQTFTRVFVSKAN